MNRQTWQRLLEVFAVFAKLGLISFGGPAAHIALMERELVQKRKWLDRQTFLDLNSVSQFIPGPNSTELAIHIGYKRAGWLGLVAAGVAFIMPAMIVVAVIAAFYVQYAALPQVEQMFYGIKPVIAAIIVHAVWLLAKSAVKNTALAVIGQLSLAAIWFGVYELVVLAAAGIGYWLWQTRQTRKTTTLGLHPASFLLPITAISGTLLAKAGTPLAATGNISPETVFWTFVKIGAVLYGSGYVLYAYLQTDFVTRLGAITEQQLIDAVTIGQFTPGPLFTTATFIGYLLHGYGGAVLATIAIFLPAFLFVALIAPWTEQIRRRPALAVILDGVNVGSLAFIAFIAGSLLQTVATDGLQLTIAVISFVCLLRFPWNSAWYVLAGAAFGLLLSVPGII